MKLGEILQEKDSSVKVIPWRKGMGVGEFWPERDCRLVVAPERKGIGVGEYWLEETIIMAALGTKSIVLEECCQI